MKKKTITLFTCLLLPFSAFAGDIYGLSQNRLKLISESNELRSVSSNLTIESISLLKDDDSDYFDANYEIKLGDHNSNLTKCFHVSFQYLGSGNHEIIEIKSCP